MPPPRSARTWRSWRPHCRWTSGRWEELDLRWNQIENLPRHTHELSSFLIRTHVQARAAQR